MSKYRVEEVDGKFYPMVKDGWFLWEYIDADQVSDVHKDRSIFSECDTLEKAVEVIERRKKHTAKPKAIYHKVK